MSRYMYVHPSWCVIMHVCVCMWPVSMNEQQILVDSRQYWQKDPRDLWRLKNSHQRLQLDAHILCQLSSLQYL